MMNIAGMKFVDDEQVIGKWEYVDTVNNVLEFNPISSQKVINVEWYNEIYFLPGGKGYWIFEGWTKGYLIIHYGGNAPILMCKYLIKKINDCDYMFIEKSENDNNLVYVMKKVSSKNFQLSDFAREKMWTYHLKSTKRL